MIDVPFDVREPDRTTAVQPNAASICADTTIVTETSEETRVMMVRMSTTTVVAVSVFAACIASAFAQAPTMKFSNQTSSFLAPSAIASVLSDTQSRKLITNDFDQDGDVDVVVVRCTSSFGPLPSIFLQNTGGVLDDRTAALAQASMVAGSSGFLDSTATTAAVAVDINGDGWTDIVTAVQWSGGPVPPKYIGYPRVYVNRGLDAFGQWLGFMFDDKDRIPNFPFNPAFRCLDAGDIDQDGDADLYFGNVDVVGNSSTEDVLLMNDGTGYFTDQTALRMPFGFSQSVVTRDVQIIDMNGDGKRDICRACVATSGDDVSIVYNGASVGNFSTRWLWTGVMGTLFAPERILMRDLNGDGRPDMVNSRGYRVFHNGNVAGQATFAVVGVNLPQTGSVLRVADLDGSGYPEIIFVTPGLGGGGIVRNLGPSGAFLNLNPPTPLVTLVDGLTNGETFGIDVAELVGASDTAAVDWDQDGDLDLMVATGSGTRIYRNLPYGEAGFSYGSVIHPDFPAFTHNSNTVTITPMGAFNPAPPTAALIYRVDNGTMLSRPLTPTSPGQYTIDFPYLTRCGSKFEWAVSIVDPGSGSVERDPPTGFYAQTVVPSAAATIISESFEATAPGWTVSSSGASPGGNWELAAPFGVAPLFATQYAPSTDSEPDPAKVRCFVTENGSGELFTHDVDGGPKRLISPVIDFSQAFDPYIAFDYWYTSTSQNLLMLVEITADGVNWVPVQSLVTPTSRASWRRFDFRPADFLTPTATTQVRFSVSDPSGSIIVEAAVDHFIAGDASGCQESVGFAGPGSLALSVCGGDLSIGTAAEIRLAGVLHNDVAYFVAHPTLEPFAVAGGMIVSATPLAVAAVPTPAAGDLVLPGLIGGIGPLTLYLQALQVDGTLPEYLAFSNIVRIEFLP